MKNLRKIVTKGVILSMVLSSGVALADSGEDVVYKNVTLEEGRLYQHDGYGAQWALDTGSDGLWFVPKEDVEGTYTAPLKIRNNAAANTLVIGNNDDENGTSGYVGIGTDAPTAKLNVAHDGPGTESVYSLVTLSANDTDGEGPSEAAFTLKNVKADKEWLFRTIDDGKAFTATLDGTGGAEFKVSSPTGAVAGTELYLGNGAKNLGGAWINASSRALKENIKPLSTKEAIKAFSQLQPVTYNYKTDKSEKVVGFIAEDVPELVSINSRDGLSTMDMVAVLTKVVQEQDKKIQKLEAMQKRLTKLETLLTNLALKTSNKDQDKLSLLKK